jgi:hypothetical protein
MEPGGVFAIGWQPLSLALGNALILWDDVAPDDLGGILNLAGLAGNEFWRRQRIAKR